MKSKKPELNVRKGPTQERSKATFSLILETTTRFLEKWNLDQLSTNKIAEHAGISIGSLYQYFPSKEAILKSLLELYIKRENAIIVKELDKFTSREKTLTFYEAIDIIIGACLESKIKQKKLSKIVAQHFLGLMNAEYVTKLDENLMELIKNHIFIHQNELRKQDLDLGIFLALQIVKVIPFTVLFHQKWELSDPLLRKEIVNLVFVALTKRLPVASTGIN